MSSTKKIVLLVLLIVILDQATKLAVKGFDLSFIGLYHQGMYLGESINVVGDFFKFTFIENPGIAFGIKVEGRWKLYLSILTVVAIIILIFFLYKTKDKPLYKRIPLAIILGGAIGNMIDRIFYGVFYGYAPLFYGSVVDFFDFDFFDITIFGKNFDRFPIFNIADMAVTIGVALLLFVDFEDKKNKEIEQLSTDAEEKSEEKEIEGEIVSEKSVLDKGCIVEENANAENIEKSKLNKEKEI